MPCYDPPWDPKTAPRNPEVQRYIDTFAEIEEYCREVRNGEAFPGSPEALAQGVIDIMHRRFGTTKVLTGLSAEQEARDLLVRYGVQEAQSFSGGDVVELANLIADAHAYHAAKKRLS